MSALLPTAFSPYGAKINLREETRTADSFDLHLLDQEWLQDYRKVEHREPPSRMKQACSMSARFTLNEDCVLFSGVALGRSD